MALMETLDTILGLSLRSHELGPGHMTARSIVVYVFTLVVVRLGDKRFLGRSTAFDMVLTILLGSVLSRGVNGQAAFGGTLVAGAVLVGLHWLTAVLAFHSTRIGTAVKGREREVVRDGRYVEDQQRQAHLSRHDVEEALREQKVPGVEHVERAWLERSGRISVLPKKKPEPRVVEVQVEAGVQRVRIELES
jgi:uncharacterized membrane protein YcaP (DUF421 family)